jgi:hypothetical protein
VAVALLAVLAVLVGAVLAYQLVRPTTEQRTLVAVAVAKTNQPQLLVLAVPV